MATSNPRASSLDAVPHADGVIARLACARARARGVALLPLLKKANLTVEQIDDPRVRLAVQDQICLLNLIADALPDDLLGLHLAQHCDLREMGLLYYVLASSETVIEALRAACGTGCSSTKACCNSAPVKGRSVSHSGMSASAVNSTATSPNGGWCCWCACCASSRDFASRPAGCALFTPAARAPGSSPRTSARRSSQCRCRRNHLRRDDRGRAHRQRGPLSQQVPCGSLRRGPGPPAPRPRLIPSHGRERDRADAAARRSPDRRHRAPARARRTNVGAPTERGRPDLFRAPEPAAARARRSPPC